MKRIISFVLILMLAAMAIGCDKLPEEPPSVSPSPTESQTETPTEAPSDTPVLPVLSEMSEKDCINKLRELGADIPEDPQFDIRGMVRDFEEDIDRPYPSDVYFDKQHALFESVRAAVRAYYAESGFPEHEPTDEPTGEPAGTPAPTAVPEADGPKVYAGSDVFFVSYPDGSLYGWGNNEHGQLGLGNTENVSAPVHIADGLTPVIVGDTVFALSADNILWGWGRNDRGQLGTGDTQDALRPVELMHFVKAIGKVWDGYGVLTEVGDLYYWQTGSEPMAAELGLENVRQICGNFAVTEADELYLFDYENGWIKRCGDVQEVYDEQSGSLIEGTDGKLYALRGDERLLVAEDYSSVTVDDGTAYILMNDGKLYSYVLMESDYTDTPEDSMFVLNFLMDGVVKFFSHTEVGEDWCFAQRFALKANGELWAWGAYDRAPLGKAEDSDAHTPECVAADVRDFIANGAQTYVITNSGAVEATGLGGENGLLYGSLGDGTDRTRFGFVDIGLGNISAVFSKLNEVYIDYDDGTDSIELYSRTFAVDNDGELWAWGWNGDGFLGVDSAEETVLEPVRVEIER